MTPPKIALALLTVLLLINGNASGQPPDRWRQEPPDVGVAFLVAGRPLPKEAKGGGEAFVAVPQWGVDYEIQITNNERHDRVLFVIGVDGLSVMDGSRASEHSGGYVLDPGQSTRIRGWRRGLDRVASFTFTHSDDSYAGRTDRRSHIGEVWVWAVREQSAPPVVEPRFGARAEKAAGKSADRSSGETGTGYGDERVDHVRTTGFARSGSVRYLGYRYGLRPAIEPSRHSESHGGSFTPAPPGWRTK